MATGYIPSRDALLVPWVENFSALITASPTSYGLVAADAVALAALVTAYTAAYTLAISGGTRGPSTISAKDAARANVIARSRQLATIIQANPAITDMQKTNLGITVRKTNLTPIPAPSTSPLLTFIAATPLQHTMRVSDQLTPDLRAKPFGAIRCVINVFVGLVPPVPGQLVTFQVVMTKNPVAINFTEDQANKNAYYLAFWQTRRALDGPPSTMISQVILGA